MMRLSCLFEDGALLRVESFKKYGRPILVKYLVTKASHQVTFKFVKTSVLPVVQRVTAYVVMGRRRSITGRLLSIASSVTDDRGPQGDAWRGVADRRAGLDRTRSRYALAVETPDTAYQFNAPQQVGQQREKITRCALGASRLANIELWEDTQANTEGDALSSPGSGWCSSVATQHRGERCDEKRLHE
jgi:hypothetical protein